MKEMTTKEVQQLSLDILQDFHDFCVKNNLHYSLSGGTLLGAIRHNGFIPWDDDIDVQMPRPDYDIFINSYISDKGYKVYCRELKECEKKNMSYPYARICDTGKTIVDTGRRQWIQEQVGVWIDVLPCDGAPSDLKDAKKMMKKLTPLVIKSYWWGIKHSPWTYVLKERTALGKLKTIVKKLLPEFFFHNLFEDIYKIRHMYDYCSSDYFITTVHYGMKEWQPKTNMGSFLLHNFEGRQFFIMSGFDANLKSLYGDYMKLPPEDQRVSHDYNKYYCID